MTIHDRKDDRINVPVCIAGMHRSGTSMVAKLLHQSGLYLGKDDELLGPASDNPDGFWENIQFVRINDELLLKAGGAWDLPPDMRNRWRNIPGLGSLREKAQKTVHQFEMHGPWGWKDPRNSLTAEFWQDIIGKEHLRFVICVRNPLEVARSIHKRSYNSFIFGLNLWHQYNRAVMDLTSPSQRMITHYDSFFSDPEEELNRLLVFAGIPAMQSAVRSACSHISTSLRHHSSSGRELIKAGASAKLVDLYEELCAQAGPVYQRTCSSAVSKTAAPPERTMSNIPRKKGFISIVILTFNQLTYTKECVESIRKHTSEPHEIIFVDNGSTDGTVKWLKKLIKINDNYTLIENTTNLGFSKGCNQGIKESSGEYILLLNNDVVVTKDWLSGMLECLNSAPDVGIVGPMTNSISGPQMVAHVDYSSPDQLAAYARKFRDEHRHRRIPLRRIVGFCMLFRRDLVERIGSLDESFGTGNYEDDDFCLRSALAGCRNFIAGDVFIHHHGSRSFVGNNIHYGSAMSGNKKIYNSKWGAVRADTTPGKNLLVIQALGKAEELHRKDQSDTALTVLIDALKYAPDDGRIYSHLTNILLEIKQYEQALDVIDRAPHHDTDAHWLCMAGYCREGLASYEEAAELAARALALRPGYASALNLQGVIAFRNEEQASAEPFFRQAMAADPGYGEPYTNLGVLLWSQGDQQAGLNLLERGFILAPVSPDASTLYHSAATASGAFNDAERNFREACSLYPDLRRTCFLLIDLLLNQDKYREALALTHDAMIAFGIDDGILSAALDIISKLGSPDALRAKKVSDTLTVCMIVKNEEAHLLKCLMSIESLADEIIVVDTGSADRTKGLARSFGAKVFDVPWTGDFSEARNVSLDKASGGWIFVLDADEVISPKDHDAIRKLISSTKNAPAAYAVTTRNYISAMNITGWTMNKGEYPAEETGSGWKPSTKTRLFTNDPRIRFENRVHELVESSLAKIGITSKPCDIPVHHYGKLKEETVMKKGEDYFLLGREKLKETSDPQALYELAVQAGELDRFDDAIELWEQFLGIQNVPPELFLRAHINLGYAFVQQGRYDDAFSISKKAIALAPDAPGAIMNYSLAELWRGDPQNAVPLLEDLLKSTPDHPPAIGMLAIASLIAGQADSARRSFEQLRTQGFLHELYLLHHVQKLTEAGRTDRAIVMLENTAAAGLGTEKLNTVLEECRRRSMN